MAAAVAAAGPLDNQIAAGEGEMDAAAAGSAAAGGKEAAAGAAAGGGGAGGHALYQLPVSIRKQLLVLLQDLQQLLCTLLAEVPLPVGCNNPGCSNLAGMAEASLGCNKRCSQCMASHYCSKACQTLHWPQHKVSKNTSCPTLPPTLQLHCCLH